MAVTERFAKIVPAGDAPRLNVVSDEMEVLVHGRDTAGDMALLHCETRAGEGTPLHIHRREDETFYILEGEYDFRVGDSVRRVGPGCTVFGARNIPHCYRNAGTAPARMLLVVSPAGFEEFFEAVGCLAQKQTISVEELARMAAAYGCEIIGPPIGG